MAKKCARTFSIVVEKGKKSILDVGHLLPGGIARYVRPADDTIQLYAADRYVCIYISRESHPNVWASASMKRNSMNSSRIISLSALFLWICATISSEPVTRANSFWASFGLKSGVNSSKFWIQRYSSLKFIVSSSSSIDRTFQNCCVPDPLPAPTTVLGLSTE